MNHQDHERHAFPIGSIVLALGFAGVMLLTWLLVKPTPPPDELKAVLRPEFRPIAPFVLSSGGYGPITEKNLRDRWTFVFFGYLSCPDVCPNTLHELNTLWNRLRDETSTEPEQVQVLFVSVDPDRDSTDRLASYVAHFNRRFIGATAGKGQIDRFARQFGAGYEFETELAPGQYLVAHTSAIFLVDPHARAVATFSQPHYASTIHRQFRQIEDWFEGRT
ncbi:MAG: SCO family protein [Gammaproteobacteria bacterium]|nr:SCO family protein [Gammaproteobacteria bacterium]